MADDLIERLLGVFARVSRTKGVSTGVSGMTIEAQSQATMHRISAWDMDVLPDAADEIARLRAAIEAEIAWCEATFLDPSLYTARLRRIINPETAND